ncbi:phosphatidylinositol/phosphatidylcholine transfer protein SFH11 isoform X1 [Nicotiana sylvestris]|uniref:Phosphatidylinositol/phosphatidylcholine transfer protein SFH11 isoform X1 n=1 Tax=Nicotiana sylvestris TaxID=4096 RepID=A0A1U7V9J8_NICSY|nr:PREDICTED: phosphatidylinositol/phosphatidylcholine transfer protein SFH11 isoform X1 [Nicotiana sylvestris]XP_009763044.1 PREDICTED: phosphatidylinositol/phosphatidylcholine transfer protein SFH11 isoform X1 [Nicotiana sylvestris]XP_009763045.1 PREDICTED: phosphatidylinositol/phosphatidylcholine transfer protein SFH11 isoform X1 [Nicotiana sylvestris]
MQTSKDTFKEILISAGIRGSKRSSSSKESQSIKQKAKILHPPIETFWQLPPTKEHKKSTGSRTLKTIMSLSLKKGVQKSKSLRTILEGSHEPKDEQIVDSFRQLLFLEGQLPGKHSEYHTLLRFLRMRDYDLTKAKNMYLNYLKWREEFHVDALSEELNFEEFNEVKNCYPHGFHGVDRYGRPIYIERIGMVNLNRLLEVTTIERFVKYHVTEQEKTLNWRYPACSLAAKKHIASTVSILDVKDVGMSNFSKPARYLFLEIQKIDSHYYPETLHRLFIINAGSGFKVLWKAIKTFLDQRTLAKIQVLGSNYSKTLLEVIDPSNLPTFFGGNCTCSDYGGCLFSDKGPWNDPAVTTILQAMVEAEEENGNDEKNGSATKDAFGGVTDNVHIKDVYDATPSRNDTFEIARLTNQPFLQKILTLQSVVNDTKTKIQALEAALKDTKSVIEGLGQPIEELKNQIIVSNIRG